MTDADAALLASFRDGTLPPAELRHVVHVRLAWLYLEEAPATPRVNGSERTPPGGVRSALARYAADLRRYAAGIGAAGKYHETITWAWLLLINERRARGREVTWEAFAAANPDLLASGALRRWYRAETLASPLAREVFMLPDRLTPAQEPA